MSLYAKTARKQSSSIRAILASQTCLSLMIPISFPERISSSRNPLMATGSMKRQTARQNFSKSSRMPFPAAATSSFRPLPLAVHRSCSTISRNSCQAVSFQLFPLWLIALWPLKQPRSCSSIRMSMMKRHGPSIKNRGDASSTCPTSIILKHRKNRGPSMTCQAQ